MKDWLGQEYDVGDKVIYAAGSGRSITMVLAEVVKIRKVYRDTDNFKWVDMPLDGPVPFKSKWNHELKDYEPTEEHVDTELRVTVQPLGSSRWQQHYGRTSYIDTRSGKGIDPFSGNGKHMVGDYYEHDVTGERVNREQARERDDFPLFVTYYDWGAPGKTPEGWHFVKQEFKDYVKRVDKKPGPVTLIVTENIVKWVDREALEIEIRHRDWHDSAWEQGCYLCDIERSTGKPA